MSEPQTEAIRDHLTRVLASPLFDRSQRQSAFLRFVVEKTIEGRKEDIKEYEIAVQVYERRVDHSTRTDPIVRVEASRLRAKLLEYYSGEGREESIRIELPALYGRRRARRACDPARAQTLARAEGK